MVRFHLVPITRCTCVVLSILFWAAIDAGSVPAADKNVRQPAGTFVMQQVGAQNVSDRKLSSAKWDGIVIRERWATLQPSPTTTDWSFIDQQIERARRFKKNYILAMYTGNNAPRWLDVPLYQGAPYPWDSQMLAAHGRIVALLGERYGDDLNLVAVELSGPTRGPSGSLEMHLAEGLTKETGYSEARVITAWKECIDQYATAFPSCGLISDGGVAPGGGRATVTQAVFDYLYERYPDQANVSHCALKASTPEKGLHHAIVLRMGRQGCRIGFEMIGPSLGGVDGEKGPVRRFGGSFERALRTAERAHAQWLKVYQADERNLPD